MKGLESYAVAHGRDETSPRDRHGLWQYLFVVAVFATLLAFTRSRVLNDTKDYVSDIYSSMGCSSITECPTLWEPGHLLLRPIGYLISRPLLPFLAPLFDGNARIAITLILVSLNSLATLIATLLLYAILIKHIGRVKVSLFVTAGFLCTSMNLNSLHAGTSYSIGLACLIGATWYTQRAGSNGHTRFVVFAGLLGGLAVAFWLPYVVALPALLCWALFSRPYRRWETAIVLTLTAAFFGFVLFGLGAHFGGVKSVAEFRTWLNAASHGTKQTHNLMRSIFGLPRSFLDLGSFGVRMKQFIFKDPYARVSIGELFGQTIWKIALFYVALLGLLSLCRTVQGRKDLGVLGIAFIANAMLAVGFEGGSAERYLPLYPFLFIAVALCLCIKQTPRVFKLAICLLLGLIIIGNVSSMNVWRVHAEQNEAVQRLRPLLPLPPNSRLFVIGLQDNILLLRSNAPFHEINRYGNLDVGSIYTPMMNTSSWEHDFAARVLSVWSQGGSVWVSTRVWSEQPRREWDWVEGDLPGVTWKGIIKFFGPLDHTSNNITEDGFALLRRSVENESILQSYANKN
jgi:hypothetical protein